MKRKSLGEYVIRAFAGLAVAALLTPTMVLGQSLHFSGDGHSAHAQGSEILAGSQRFALLQRTAPPPRERGNQRQRQQPNKQRQQRNQQRRQRPSPPRATQRLRGRVLREQPRQNVRQARPQRARPRSVPPARRARPRHRSSASSRTPRYNWNQYRQGRRPPEWNRHRDFNRYRWQGNIRASRRFRWTRYEGPPGWRYRRWYYGEYLPHIFWVRHYWLLDYWRFGLVNPPYGYVWVRFGTDAILVDVYSGLILRVVYGVFY